MQCATQWESAPTPDAPGMAAISRFHRLELIDPTADAAETWQNFTASTL